MTPGGRARGHTEDVTFRDGGAMLAGELSVPATPGPHPALAMIHGSGGVDRTNHGVFPPIRDRFVRSGIAVLCYDKPGTGSSTGDWTRQSFPEDRVTEALAAVRFLRERDGIDAGRVGLWGVSQGGWVVPLAASRCDGVAFVVVVAAPGVTPGEQNAFEARMRMRSARHPEEVVRDAGRYVEALMEAARQQWPYDRLREELLEPARGEPWHSSFRITSADSWAFLMRSDSAYDPRTALERLTCPVLAVYGAEDRLVPVGRSVEVFEQGLREAGNEHVRIEVFPGADHQLCGPGGTFAPGYLELMSGWVAEVTAAR